MEKIPDGRRLDKTLIPDVREARRFVRETMTKVRDGNLDLKKAEIVFKGAKELTNLGRLEIQAAKYETE